MLLASPAFSFKTHSVVLNRSLKRSRCVVVIVNLFFGDHLIRGTWRRKTIETRRGSFFKGGRWGASDETKSIIGMRELKISTEYPEASLGVRLALGLPTSTDEIPGDFFDSLEFPEIFRFLLYNYSLLFYFLI